MTTPSTGTESLPDTASSTARRPRWPRSLLLSIAVLVLIALGCGSDDRDQTASMTFDSYLASLGYDYNPARDIGELAQWSAVATVATLVDVEDGRSFGDTVDSPEGRHLNLVFETADSTRYYVQLPRPESSSIEQLRSVLPVGTESVIYLQPNSDPDDGVWFNKREDGNE